MGPIYKNSGSNGAAAAGPTRTADAVPSGDENETGLAYLYELHVDDWPDHIGPLETGSIRIDMQYHSASPETAVSSAMAWPLVKLVMFLPRHLKSTSMSNHCRRSDNQNGSAALSEDSSSTSLQHQPMSPLVIQSPSP